MEKKQTAVEFLYDTLDMHLVDYLDGDISLNDLSVKMLEFKYQALQMEKDQKNKAAEEGYKKGFIDGSLKFK